MLHIRSSLAVNFQTNLEGNHGLMQRYAHYISSVQPQRAVSGVMRCNLGRLSDENIRYQRRMKESEETDNKACKPFR